MQNEGSGSGATGGGRGAVARFAPAAAVALDDAEAIVWRRVDVDLLDLAAQLFSSIHEIPALARPAECGPSPWQGRDASEWRTFSDLDASQKGALAFAEQFAPRRLGRRRRPARDAHPIPGRQGGGVRAGDLHRRRDSAGALRARSDLRGEQPHGVTFDESTRRGRDRLERDRGDHPRDPGSPGPRRRHDGARAAARVHGRISCRFCQSVRSRSAMVAGANDAMFEAVDAYRDERSARGREGGARIHRHVHLDPRPPLAGRGRRI